MIILLLYIVVKWTLRIKSVQSMYQLPPNSSFNIILNPQGPVVTDNGNFIIDWKFDTSREFNWKSVNNDLMMMPGKINNIWLKQLLIIESQSPLNYLIHSYRIMAPIVHILGYNWGIVEFFYWFLPQCLMEWLQNLNTFVKQMCGLWLSVCDSVQLPNGNTINLVLIYNLS